MDGNQLEEQSLENTSLDEYFLTAVYKERLKWTGHAIPVSFIYWGLRLEGYLFTVGKINLEKPNVEVKLAFIGDKIAHSLYVHYSNILPTQRQLFDIVDNNNFKPTSAVQNWSVDYPKQAFSEPNLLKIPLVLPGINFTLAELAAILETEENLIKSTYLEPNGTKYCLMTGTKTQAYSINTMSNYSPNESLIDIQKEYETCQLCPLGVSRVAENRNLVFGRKGPGSPKGFILAEAPGVKEEQDKIPLHPDTPAGSVLKRVMDRAELSQDEFYLTNTVICRPLPQDSTTQNGKPTDESIKCCSTRLKRTLRAVSPKVVVLLGTFAYTAWFGHEPAGGISKQIGDKTQYNSEGRAINYLVYVTYHPSYVARNENNTELKKTYLEHWKHIKSMMESIK